MLKGKIYYALAIIIIPILQACGTQRTYLGTSPQKGFGQYAIIEIHDFDTTTISAPTEVFWSIPNDIAERLTNEKLFVGVSRSPVDITDSVIVMEGTVTDFTPRDWYKQLIESGKIVVRIRFIDKSNQYIVADASFEGTAKWGALGGGMHFADKRLVDEIVKFIKVNFSN